MDKVLTKVKDLTPQSKQVNVLAKVVGFSEEREITSRFGEARKLVEATVGDETGTVLVDKGFVSLVRGHIRLNVGKYGSITKSDQAIDPVNTSLDVSAVEYEREPRYRSGGYSGDRDRGGGGGGGGRQYSFGTFGGDRRERKDR